MGGRWIPVIIQTAGYRYFQLAEKQRGSAVNHCKAVCDAHAGTGDCCQTSYRADRESEEAPLGFVHFVEIFMDSFILVDLLSAVYLQWFCSATYTVGKAGQLWTTDNSTENLKESSDIPGFQYCYPPS